MPDKKSRVLIVDDNRTTRLMIRKLLEETGFAVVEAENGLKALEIFPQIQPDAVLLDVEMPVMNGFSACAELRKLPQGQYIPIMMVTTLDDPSSINKAYEVGATEFTIKPINWEILGHRVRYLIRTGQQFMELLQTQAALNKARSELETINMELEKRVIKRTEQYKKASEELQAALDALRAAEAQLIESEKSSLLGDLLDGIAREVHAPIDISIHDLISLQQNLTHVSSQFDQNTLKRIELENYLKLCHQVTNSIDTHLQKVSALIKNFKQLSVDKTTETYSQFNLKDRLEEILLELRPVLKNTQLRMDIHCSDHLIVNSYPTILLRIIMNLITYSITRSDVPPKNGVITLDAAINKDDADKVVLVYSDDGEPISEYKLSKIFEPFFIIKNSDKNAGLGLYLVQYQVTKILGGTIKCENNPEKGLTFTIIFPGNRHK